MTVSSSSTFEFNINQIVRLSYIKAGLMNEMQALSGPQWTARAALGMDFLQLIVSKLQSNGVFVRAVDFYEVTATAGTASYELPASTLDLIGVATYLGEGETTGETSVFPMDRETWLRISDKTAQGRPSRYYADRQAALTVYLHNVPADAGTVTFQRHRLLGTVRNGSDTVDLERHWTSYLVNMLASDLALSAGLDKKAETLVQRAAVDREEAKGYSKQRGAAQMHVAHRTRWGR